MKLEAGESPAAAFCETMKTKRNRIHASIRMVGTPRCGVRTAQRAVPTFRWQNLIQIWLLCAVMLQALTSDAQPVTQIAAGRVHSLFLKSDGSLWGMGENYSGQLGDGTNNSTNRPELILASNVTAIAAGHDFSLFLKSDGSLWGMGESWYGQLGDGNGSIGSKVDCNTNRPEQIVSSNVMAIAAGWNYSLFLKSDGSLWGMGENHDGKLGDGTINWTNRPEQIVSSNVTAITAGMSHSLFLKGDGSLWGMGGNGGGQLGVGNLQDTNEPELIVASNVTAIAAGMSHSLFLKSDGSLWGMGFNFSGRLGELVGGGFPDNPNPAKPEPRGERNAATGRVEIIVENMFVVWQRDTKISRPQRIVASNVTAIATGTGHSLFLKSDGSLWGMGLSTYGELGYGTYFWTNRPVQIVSSNVTTIAIGAGHSLFLKRDGSLWTMGYNGEGQLGDGTTNNTNLPERIVAGSRR